MNTLNIKKKVIKPYIKLRSLLNRSIKKKECYVCNKKFQGFLKHRGGFKYVSSWQKKLNLVGSDIDNFWCMYCKSTDRERHLFMYFDKLEIWSKMEGADILHFAPERNLSKKINKCSPNQYVKGDLYPKENEIQKIDLTNVPYSANSFDLLICNHVLEHVPDYMKAMKEIFRVLRPGGEAILQTPFSKLLHNNFEDKGINTDELRLLYYGQEDHVRHFSERQFFRNMIDVGFDLKISKHKDLFDDKSSFYFGVNEKEDLIRVIKPLT